MLCQYQETARKHAGCTITYSTLAVWILWLLDRSPASRHPSLTNPLLSQYNPEGAEEKNQSRRRLKLVLKTFKKLSSERVPSECSKSRYIGELFLLGAVHILRNIGWGEGGGLPDLLQYYMGEVCRDPQIVLRNI